MIRINLLRVEEAQAAQARNQEVVVGAAIVLVGALAAGIVWWVNSNKIASLDAKIAALQTSLEALQAEVKEVAELERQIEDLSAKLATIEKLESARVGPVEVLVDLSNATPERLWLTDFSESGGSARLTGAAIDDQTIAQFAQKLQESIYFNGVDLQEARGQGSRLRSFIMNASINYAASAKSADQNAREGEGVPEEPAS